MNALLPMIIRSSGWMFLESAKYLDENFGLEGRNILRKATRDVGTWRGNQLRKAHKALGLPINMENIAKYWDSPSATKHLIDIWEKEGDWHPSNVYAPTPYSENACPMSGPWRETDEWLLGHILCDEFHVKFINGYHPDAICVMPECMMKGDDLCSFRFMMPPNAVNPEDIPLYEGENPAEDWQGEGYKKLYGELRRKTRITLGRMYTLFNAIKEARPYDYEKIFGDIVDRWSKRRAEDEIKKCEELGLEKTPYNLFMNIDTPYQYVWDMDVVNDDDKFEMEIHYCPYLETWNWMGDIKDFSLYCDHCYCNLVEGFNNNYKAELTRCMAKGDSSCKVEVSKT